MRLWFFIGSAGLKGPGVKTHNKVLMSGLQNERKAVLYIPEILTFPPKVVYVTREEMASLRSRWG